MDRKRLLIIGIAVFVALLSIALLALYLNTPNCSMQRPDLCANSCSADSDCMRSLCGCISASETCHMDLPSNIALSIKLPDCKCESGICSPQPECKTDEDCNRCTGTKLHPGACENGECGVRKTPECSKECGAECESYKDCEQSDCNPEDCTCSIKYCDFDSQCGAPYCNGSFVVIPQCEYNGRCGLEPWKDQKCSKNCSAECEWDNDCEEGSYCNVTTCECIKAQPLELELKGKDEYTLGEEIEFNLTVKGLIYTGSWYLAEIVKFENGSWEKIGWGIGCGFSCTENQTNCGARVGCAAPERMCFRTLDETLSWLTWDNRYRTENRTLFRWTWDQRDCEYTKIECERDNETVEWECANCTYAGPGRYKFVFYYTTECPVPRYFGDGTTIKEIEKEFTLA